MCGCVELIKCGRLMTRSHLTVISLWFIDRRANQVRSPLMANVEYLGFCLIATALLPISPTTLVYGSSDAGQTIVCEENDAQVAVMSLARSLNLAAHRVQDSVGCIKTMHGPVDLEVHRLPSKEGKDHLHVLDPARLYPAACPELSPRSQLNGHLTQLLRPELLRRYPIPVSSDCFSMFGALDAGLSL
jgi:hypothetical protein